MMDNHEKLFEENLRTIGRRVPRPADATDRQVRRWVNLVKITRPTPTRRFLGVWNSPKVRRWTLSAAAAAVVAVGLLAAFQTKPQPVSAEDVFQQVGTSLETQPVLHLIVENVELHGQRLNFEFAGTEEGRAMYARVDAASVEENPDHPLALDMTLARDGNKGWVLVRNLRWDDRNPMGHLIPEDGALLIDVPVSRGTNEAVRQMFPVAVRQQDVQALIESLRRAVPDLKIRTADDGTVLLEGVITEPTRLDLRMLCETTNATRIIAGISPALMSGMKKRDLRKIVKSTKESLRRRMSDEDYQAVCRRLDMIAMLAMQQLQAGAPEDLAEASDESIRNLRLLLTGATISIAYDPRQKLLRSVYMSNVGPSEGTVQLRFDEPDIRRSRLDRTRFAEEPNLRTMTRDEVIFSMLMPMMLPAGGNGTVEKEKENQAP
ncbi:MAG: hypothetical protein JXA11_04445 [Phycisphaerae bacterium]|nr:hypothetical protein [Phycisphaerae bacterium]